MIAILGGTFDPIHFGHLRPALEICEKLSLSELRFIPSAKPPHRFQPQASAEHRLKMVKKAIKAYPKFVLDDREYQRLEQDSVDNHASYTIDTVRSIREEIGESEAFCMILGMDAFQTFTQWRDWENILDNVHLIVASRPGYSFAVNDQDLDQDHDWVKNRLVTDANELSKSTAGKVYFCEVTQLDISATYIREQMSDGKSCSYLSPKKVIKYIKKHTLYETWS